MKQNKEKLRDDFLRKCKEKHGDLYDYSKVDYINSKTHVTIICPIHGEFSMTPSHHLSGQKCPRCKGLYKTTEEWVNDAKEKHGDKYDYSETVYYGSHKPLKIVCPKHGEFELIAKDHIRGNGCPKCKFEKLGGLKRSNTDDFIKKAKMVHGEKYDYSSVVYEKSNKYVTIICPKHGEFQQTPNNHLRGCGCKRCVGKGKTTEDIINEFREVHGDKYDYSKVEYVNSKTPVVIVCPIHGEFNQTPSAHLIGQGCPSCSMSHLENKVNQIMRSCGIDVIYETNLDGKLNRYSVDFLIPKKNIIIECQGGQHFYPAFNRNDIGKATKIHENVLKRDIAKRKMIDGIGGFTVLYFTDISDLPDDVLTNKKYHGIYTKDNFFTDLDSLMSVVNEIS